MNLYHYIHNTLVNDIQSKVFEENKYMLECLCRDHHLNIKQINTWYEQFYDKRTNHKCTETPDPDISIIDDLPESSISNVVCTKSKVVRRIKFESSITDVPVSKTKRRESTPKPSKDSSTPNTMQHETSPPPESRSETIPKRRPATIPKRRPATIPKRRPATIPKRRPATIPTRSIKYVQEDTKGKMVRLREHFNKDCHNDIEMCQSFYPQ